VTTLEGDRLYEVTDHHAGKDGCNIWLRLISYRRKIEILLIEYEQILCKLLCEVLYTLIEVSGVTDGLYKHEWNIIIGYLERAMEVLTGVDASGVDPLHLHEPAHRGGVTLTIVDAAADGVDGLLTLVALRPCLRLCIVLCLRLCRKIGQLLELLQAYIPLRIWSEYGKKAEK